MSLKEKIQSLPSSPGVYLMKDSLNNIIYVGKAKNLKNRVQSYFRNSKNHTQKVKKLVQHLKDFDYILTDTEFEAFMLECELIKKMKPPYNRVMKNPLSFVYVTIRMDKKLNRISLTSLPTSNDGNLYFGPYTKRQTVERAIIGIKDCFKIHCTSHSNSGSACLNYSLGLCIGICIDEQAVERYNLIIDKFIALLNGTDNQLLLDMRKLMEEAVNEQNFEAAAKYRDYLKAVEVLLYKEKVIEFAEVNETILMIESLTKQKYKLFLIKGTKIIHREIIEPPDVHINFETLSFEHLDLQQKVTRDELDEAQIIYSYLNKQHCSYITIPNDWITKGMQSQIAETISSLINISNNIRINEPD